MLAEEELPFTPIYVLWPSISRDKILLKQELFLYFSVF